MATKKLVKLSGGKVEEVKTILSPTWVDYIKTYYAKAIVVGSALAALATDLTPVLGFLPASDQKIASGIFAGIAAGVALLKKEKALVDSIADQL